MVIIVMLVIIWYMVNNYFQIVHCHVKKSLTRDPILCHMNPVHSVPFHLNKIRFNIIPSTPRSFMFHQACLCQELWNLLSRKL